MPSATSRLVSWISVVPVDGAPSAQLGVQRVERPPRRPGRRARRSTSAERVVAGRAGGRPVGGQLLVALEDLLDQHVRAAGRPRRARRGSRPGRRGRPGGRPAARRPGPRANQRTISRALVEDLAAVLDADAGERVDREEPPVVQLGVRAPPVDQLVVLPGVHLAAASPSRGAGRERERVVVVAQLAVRRPSQRRRSVVERVAEHRDAHLAAAEVPVDVERLGVAASRGRACSTSHHHAVLARGRRRPCGWARCRRARRGRRRARRPPTAVEALVAAARRVDAAVVDDVVAVVASPARPASSGER